MIHNFTIKNNKLFIGEIAAEDLVAQYGSPLYVYDANIIKRQYKSIVDNIAYPHLKIHYACKANTNVEILKLLRKEGANIETVSKEEILAAFAAGYKADEIIYTCSYITKEELKFVIEKNIIINLDSLTQLKRYGEIKPNSKVSLRLNQGIGAAHHKHNITGGPESKLGIDISYINDAQKIAKKYGLQIVGLHQHIGSGILDEKIFIKAIKKLLETAKQFSDLEFLDFGGGFGVAYKEQDVPLNMKSLGKAITKELHQFMKEYKKQLLVRFEPGRYLVAESGILLATVTDIKKTPYQTFVGVDSGFNHLLRPILYGSYHQIVNASRVKGKQELVTVVGNICESGDIFGKDRKATKFKEDDIIAIFNSGAYGYTLASFNSSRPMPMETLVDGKKSQLIREQNDYKILNETTKKKLQ